MESFLDIESKVPHYPLYLNSFFFSVFSKKIILGISCAFEVKALISSEKKSGFLEVKQETFLKFLMLLDEIVNHVENEAAASRNLLLIGECIHVKISTKQAKKIMSLFDAHRDINIQFSIEELKKIIEYRNLMYYDINRLVINTNAVFNLYGDYLKIASSKNCARLTQYECFSPSLAPSGFTLDYQQIFYEFFPIFGEAKIRRDIETLGFNNILNSIM